MKKHGEIKDQSDDDWMQMFQTNVMGHVRMIRSLLPYFNNPSHILNIGSMGGFQGSEKFNGLSSYSASKAALHTLTECLAEEFKDLVGSRKARHDVIQHSSKFIQ